MAAGLCALLGSAGPVLAQSAVKLRSALHDGYGRLVFDWPRAVRFEASLTGNQLLLRFDEALAADLGSPAVKRLDGYLSHPVIAPDRRSITFDVLRPITVRGFVNERSAVVDLVDQPAGSAPAANAQTPAPPAAPAASARPSPPDTRGPTLPVRVGEHKDFTRLVFDWPQMVEYRVEKQGGRATIQFDRTAQLDLATLRNALPRSVGQAEVFGNGPGMGISFMIPPNTELRHSRNGAAVVVDVMAPPDATPATAEAASPPAASPPPAPPAPSIAAAAAPAGPSASPAASPTAAAPPAAVPPPAASSAVTPPGGAPSAGAAPAGAAPSAPAVAPAPPAVAAVKPAVEPQMVAVSISQTAAGPRLRLPWRQMPAAAVFTRGNAVYVVFDKPARFDFTGLRKPVDRIGAPEQIEVADGSGLRFTTASNVNPVPQREQDAWSLLLRAEPRRPLTAAPVAIETTTPDGPRITVAIAGAESTVGVTDPERGELMRVVPVRTAGLGTDTNRQFAQFDMLPTNQGVVMVPRADGIDIRLAAANIVIGSNQGLLLSRAAAPASSGTAGVFDFRRWLQPDVDFTETRQSLLRAEAEADAAHRPAARFELAQFFLARDHAADAVGVLGLIVADDRRYGNDPVLKALRGAARVMLEDGAAAKADLSDPQFNSDAAVTPWRAGAAALRGEWADADQSFRRAGQLPAGYSPTIRQRLTLLAAEAALNAGDSARVRTLLDALGRTDLPAHVRAQADYLRARALIASDDRRSALPLLQRLAGSSDQWARAHGEYLLVDQQLADNTITPAEAIERLDRVRFAWSGDELEYQVLRRLGELQLEHGDVRSGLTRLREAMAHFPDNPENAAIRARMTDAFASLYDKEGPRALPPLTALALYDDFRDLTPPGARGDKMIQDLADRLVAMDLLDRAGELLDYQIKNRLSGIDKARVGARLAVVQLLDRKPAAALAALADSEGPNLPADLTAERRHLQARALAETGDSAAALALLESDTGADADQLRAETYARAQNWSQAALALNRLVGDPNDGKFDAARRRQVLNLAIAYSLAGDSEGLRSVRERFGDKMNSGATKDAFGLVTSVTEGGAVSDGALSARFAELQEFQQFMANYRERLRSSSLSAIN